MLCELAIENFAIIEQLRVSLEPRFTVLTGETGAGKSIIIDALQAALGTRVSSDLIRAGAQAASVEAVFAVTAESEGRLAAILQESGIPEDEYLILRREISSSGRSMARINGRTVPLATLASVGEGLVDIHGQSDHLSVLRRDRQLDALDRFGALLGSRSGVAEAVSEYVRLRRELANLLDGRREAEHRLDLLRFQVEEIDSAKLQPAEERDLTAERNLLGNAGRLSQLSDTAFAALQREGSGALDGLIPAVGALRDLAGIDTGLTPLYERLDGLQLELEDVAQELRRYRDAVEYDPERLNEVEDRLAVIERMKRKYGATLEDVIAFGERARVELGDVENLDARIAALQDEVRGAEIQAAEAAERLSACRRQAAEQLNEAMGAALRGLGLGSVRFEVELSRTHGADGLPLSDGTRYAFTTAGVDAATFLVSFNPGEPVRPLDRVASGGETSRFLLALKSVLADADRIPTLVFDEADVGIGARHGTVVGERLHLLATGHQVLAITHMPQVAALADHHLRVLKEVKAGRTDIAVHRLETSDRVVELAEMLSGTATETARQTARELLEAARRNR